MITLPLLATGVKAGAHAGKADASGLTDALTGDGTGVLPEGFVTLLGNRLLALAQSGAENGKAAIKAAPADEKATPVGELSALLSSLEQPGSLSTLLQPENAKGAVKSADDKEKQPLEALSDSDKQTLQALFAMLPQAAPIVPAAQQVTQATSSDLSVLSGGGKSGGNNALLSALLGKASASGETDDDGVTTPGSLLTSAGASTSGTTTASSTAAGAMGLQAGSSNSNAQQLDASFQQMLGGALKESIKDQNDNSAAVTLTSASSVAMAPTASATTSTPMTPQLNSQLGSPEWQQALSQQVLMFSRNGQQHAELRLHPEDLGSIQISLKIDNDQAQMSMVSGHSQVRAALEAAMPQLRTALADSGINLGQSDVSGETLPQNQGFTGQQENRRDAQSGMFSLGQDDEHEITPIAVPAALQARANGSGSVDIFA